MTTATPANRTRWRWLRRILWGIGITILSSWAFYLYNRWSADSETQTVAAELDRNDPGWRLHDLEKNRQVVPAAENAALVAAEAYKLLPDDWEREQAKAHGELAREITELPPPRLLPIDQEKRLRSDLDPLQPAIAAARKLAEYPRGRYAITYAPNILKTLLRDQGRLISLASLLKEDACLLLQDNRCNEALVNVHALLNGGRSIGDEPIMISTLVRISMQRSAVVTLERLLAQGEIDDGQLQRLQTALEEERAVNLYLIGIRGERATQHYFFENVETGMVSLNDDPKANAVRRWIDDVFVASVVGRSHAPLLRFQTKLIEAAKLDGMARYARIDEIYKEFEKNDKDKGQRKELAFYMSMVPAQAQTAGAERQADNLLSCAIAGLAAERFRLQQGRWPASLEELTQAKLLATIPVDLSDGKPLRLRHAPDGLVLFALGSDAKYDGTARDPQPPAKDETDLVLPPLRPPVLNANKPPVEFRLWDRDRRRQSSG